jgi:hypothetical protein
MSRSPGRWRARWMLGVRDENFIPGRERGNLTEELSDAVRRPKRALARACAPDIYHDHACRQSLAPARAEAPRAPTKAQIHRDHRGHLDGKNDPDRPCTETLVRGA